VLDGLVPTKASTSAAVTDSVPSVDNVQDSTASKEAPTKPVIDSDAGSKASTTRVALQSTNLPPEPQAPSSTENIGDVIASLLGFKTGRLDPSSELEPEPSSTSRLSHATVDSTSETQPAKTLNTNAEVPTSKSSKTSDLAIGSESLVPSIDSRQSATATNSAVLFPQGSKQDNTFDPGAELPTAIASKLSPAASNLLSASRSIKPKQSPVAIGSERLVPQATQLATTISGSSTDIPAVVLGSQTIAIGASGSIGTVPVAVTTSGSHTAVLVDGSTTHFLPQATVTQAESQPKIVVGGSTITANSNSQFIVAGQTLTPGSSITVAGTTIALPKDGQEGSMLVVGSSSSILQHQPRPTPFAAPSIIIGSSTMTANAESAYIFAGQTLVPGSSITVSGTPIALQTAGSDGSALVIGSSTSVLQQNLQATVAAAPPVIVGGSTLTANSASDYVVDGQTVKAGSSITVGSGSSTSVVELQKEGSRTILVVGSSSSVLQPQPTTVVTIGSARITPNADSGYVVGSQTLAPGASAITISGVEYSLAPGGGQIVAGSSTLILTSRPALPVGSAKITPVASSEYVIGSQTLSPGASAITVSGVKYSLASDGGQIVAGSSTQVLTSEAGVGGYIWSALGGSSAKSSAQSQHTSNTASTDSSSASAASPLESAAESQKASAAEVARPVCLWLMVGWTFAVAWV
jgi:hypothetical protein